MARHADEGLCPNLDFAPLFGTARGLVDAHYSITAVDGRIGWRK